MTGRRRRLHAVSRFLLAVAVAACVVSGCASSTKVNDAPAQDEILERTNRSALQAFERGNFEQAAAFYEKALNRAYIRDDFNAIMNARYNLAICLINQQSYEKAFGVVQQAKTEMAMRGSGVQVDFLLLEATVLHLTDNAGEALKITDRILSTKPEASSLIRRKTHYLRGLIAVQQGETDRLREAIASLGQPELSQLRADRYDLVGHLAMAEQNWETAIDAFDNAAALRREDLDYRKMAAALAFSALACEQAGKTPEASNRYLRAGLSAALRGEHGKARQWLERAETLAVAAGDELTAGQARSHRRKLPPN
jgi:tetratricopeptide (TPR) repeat protein